LASRKQLSFIGDTWLSTWTSRCMIGFAGNTKLRWLNKNWYGARCAF